MCSSSKRHAFTLIELLVVIAIIAILSVVVILTLNPAQLLQQSRDSNRLSDLSVTNTALSVYAAQGGSSLGSSNLLYISVPDPSATSSAGDQCQGLNLPTAPSGTTYFCGASSTDRSTNGTGWIPVNFSALSGGSPLGQLPQDPINQTSSGLYYTYSTNGTQYILTALPEAQKTKAQLATTPAITNYPDVMANGSNLGISPLYSTAGLVGYWPFEEGVGSSTSDASGNGNTGTWNGTPGGNNNTYYTGGKVGNYAGSFGGTSTNYVSISNMPATLSMTYAAWVDPTSAATYSNYPYIYANGFSGGLIIFPNGNFYIQICNFGLGNCDDSPGFHASLNTWQYVVGTFSYASGTTTLTLYINGIQAGPPNVASFGSSLGNYGAQIGGNSYQGFIDDIRIYNRALSASEIQALYNATK
jgi:prepilin-type N-terminal cleavage/methylation domain-containing protein